MRARATAVAVAVLLTATSCSEVTEATGVTGETPEQRATALVSILEDMPRVTHAEVEFVDDSDYYVVRATLHEDASADQVEDVLHELDDSADEVDADLVASPTVTLGIAHADYEGGDEEELADLLLKLGAADVPGTIGIADIDPVRLAVAVDGGPTVVADAADTIAVMDLTDVHHAQFAGVAAEAHFYDGVTVEETAAWRAMVTATASPEGYRVRALTLDPSPDSLVTKGEGDYLVVQLDPDRPLPPDQLTQRRLRPMLWPMIRGLRRAVTQYSPDAWLAVGVRDRDYRTTWVVHGAAAEITQARWTT